MLQVSGRHGLIPMSDDPGLGAVKSQGFVSYSGVPVSCPSEKADGMRIESEQLEAVLTGR